MRKHILIRDRIVQFWVLVQFFKERKDTVRVKEKEDNPYQRQKSCDRDKSIVAVSNCHWVFFLPYPFVKFLPNCKLHCRIHPHYSGMSEPLQLCHFSVLLSTSSITCVIVGCNYLFPHLSSVCDAAWFNLIHHGKIGNSV